MHRWPSGMATATIPHELTTLARRRFNLDDQVAFAELSGDWNPIHVDAIAARRTLFGAPVVHGVHVVLWAIDHIVTAPASIKRLAAVFRRPVMVGDEVTIEQRSSGWTASVGTDVAVELDLDLQPSTTSHPIVDRAWARRASDEPSRDDVTRMRGEVELAVDRALAARLFSRASVPAEQLAELVATTRIVGMHCPGLHSLLGKLALEASPTDRTTMSYEVTRAHLHYNQLSMRVVGPSLAGSIDAFLRPAPCRVAMADALATVEPSRFANQRALVVGGSRGLGEAFAKVIAAGGGEVCVTYHRGARDADQVVADITAVGRTAYALALDVLSPTLVWPLAAPPTHLYYCATPLLHSIRMGVAWSDAELDLLIRYFVTGLRATVAAAVACGSPKLVVWTPSTTMLDRPERGSAYCVAKAAMEELCRHLPLEFPVDVHAPRLGRVATDQTATLLTVAAAAPLDIAMAELATL